MKAITIWEPWATLIALGYKRVETRSWSTTWRGEIAIHAARTMKHCSFYNVNELCRRAGISDEERDHLVLSVRPGHVVAVASLVDVWTTEKVIAYDLISDRERALGDYGPNRYSWKIEDVRRIPRPFSAIGRQQIWNLSEDESERVRAQLRGE